MRPRSAPVRRATVSALALAMLLLAGCGNSRTPSPGTAPATTAQRFQTLRFATSGVSFAAPRDWKVFAQGAPLVTVLASGDAVVAVWRYPRAQPLPSDPAGLAQAEARLIATARAHDPSLQVIRAKAITVDGARAVELDAYEHIAGQPRRVRSTHVFAYGAELVVEEYAPAAMFHTVDHAVFSPLKRSLAVFPAVSSVS